MSSVDEETRLPAAVWSTEIGFWEWHPATDRLSWLNDWPARAGLHACDGDGHVVQLYEVMDPAHRDRLEPAWYAHAAGQRDRYEVEYRVRDLQGRWRWLAMRARIVEREPDGTPVRMVGAAFDVDERRRLEEAVERGRQEFEAAAAAVPAWVLLVDREQRVKFSSRGAGGRSAADLVGRLAAELPGGIGAPTFAAWHATVVRTRAPAQYGDVDPTGRVLDVRLAPVLAGGEVTGVAVSVTDVTDRAELERRLLRSESAGRRQIGTSLRETLSQELAGIAYTLWTVQQQTTSQPEVAALLQRSIAMLNGALATARTLSRGASPLAPEHGGLCNALRDLAGSRVRVSCDLAPELDARLDVLAAEHVHGIALDAVECALADPDPEAVVAISLTTRDDRLLLEIVDAGRGAAARYEEPAATSMMRFRAEQLHGSLTFDARPDGSVAVTCACPLPVVPPTG